MDKPKILHIIGAPNIGGVQKLVLGLSTNPELNNFDQMVLSINSKHGEMVQVYKENDIPVFSCIRTKTIRKFIPSYRLNETINDWLFSMDLYYKIRSLKIDLVHIQQSYYLNTQISVIKRSGQPFVYTIHGIAEKLRNLESMARMINSSSAVVTGVSKVVLERSPLHEAVDKEKQAIIYNGLNLPFYQDFKSKKEIRSHLGISPKSIVFGSAASFIPIKRHDVFIKAAAIIIEKGYDCHFILAGDGPLKPELENLVIEHNLQEKFHFLEWQTDVRDFFANIDVFVLSSDSEGCSIALLEAMAMAKPCIATAVGGNPEVLGDSGKLISPNSPLELSIAMEDLIDPNLRKGYSVSTRDNSIRFDINQTSRLYKELYKHLLFGS